MKKSIISVVMFLAAASASFALAAKTSTPPARTFTPPANSPRSSSSPSVQHAQSTDKKVGQSNKKSGELIVGVVETVYPDGLTLKVKDTDYRVTVAPKVRVLDRNGKVSSLTEIHTGDKVRTSGTVTDKNILASVIRDISLPQAKKPPQANKPLPR